MKLVLIFLLSCAAALPQTKQERGKKIVDDALAALGGPKYLSMSNRVESGRAYSFYREELSGLSVATFYIDYMKPNTAGHTAGELLLRERQSFGKEERSGAVLFTEGKGYEVTFRGARPLPQETLDRYKDTMLHNILYILRARLDEPGMIFEYQGQDIVDNRPIYKVDVTDPDNRTITVFFDQSSKLPTRQIYFRRDPKTNARNEEITIFSKFRDTGSGVLWPYDVQRLRNGEQIYQMYADSVAVNKDLTESLFVLPTGVRMLKPAR